MKTLLTLLTIFTITVTASAQSLKLDCVIDNEISVNTQILLINKTEGDIQIFNPRKNKLIAGLQMGYEYELVFQAEGCATKVLEFNLVSKDNILSDARFDFKVIMVPAKEPEQVIRAGVITYVESSKEFAYTIIK